MDGLQIKADLERFINGQIKLHEPMAHHTTWRVGGMADVLIIPQGEGDIRAVVKYSRDRKIPLYIVGNGSNLLVLDKGIRGIVLKINKVMDKIEVKNNVIITGSGAMLPKVARLAISSGLKGLEFAVGIPATVGGAVTMNAGAHGQSISEVIQEVKVVNNQGEPETIPSGDLAFQYRSSGIRKKEYLITEAVFKLQPGDLKELESRAAANLERRREAQPLTQPNAGSVFKNPSGTSAGKLIDEAGCKGMIAGQAMISEKHANFIVNLGGAKAEDIIQLIDKVRQRVKTKFNISLELEIQVVGEP